MKLLTKAIEKKLPPLYAQDGKGDEAIAYAKFFTPDSDWTWYATEYDPKTRTFFGLVFGMEAELGTFSLDELEQTTGPMGLHIERDMYFKPQTLREIREKHKAGGVGGPRGRRRGGPSRRAGRAKRQASCPIGRGRRRRAVGGAYSDADSLVAELASLYKAGRVEEAAVLLRDNATLLQGREDLLEGLSEYGDLMDALHQQSMAVAGPNGSGADALVQEIMGLYDAGRLQEAADLLRAQATILQGRDDLMAELSAFGDLMDAIGSDGEYRTAAGPYRLTTPERLFQEDEPRRRVRRPRPTAAGPEEGYYEEVGEDEYMEEAPICPMCGGIGMPLGTLGDLDWWRCRQCGMDFNTDAERAVGGRRTTSGLDDDTCALYHQYRRQEANGTYPFPPRRTAGGRRRRTTSGMVEDTCALYHQYRRQEAAGTYPFTPRTTGGARRRTSPFQLPGPRVVGRIAGRRRRR